MDHKNSQSASYAAAGVDITAGYKAVELMKKHVARTRNEGCLDDVGGFGGCFGLPVAGMEEPVLVSGTDGVAEGCVQSGSALVGGETAEHPGMMPVDDYDLAGFSVGIVDKKKIIDNTRMRAGDMVIALASTGVHSNGFSLVRKVFDVEHNDSLREPCEALGGASILETLLTPTKIYVKSILALLEKVDVKGISHITGGGFYENIPRSIPDGLCAKIKKSDVRVLPIFKLIAETGNIPERDMFNTFNMGVGMSVVVPAEQVDTALEILTAHGETAYVIGRIVENEEKVILE